MSRSRSRSPFSPAFSPAYFSPPPPNPKWVDGNLTLISVDRISFKVQDYHLLSARCGVMWATVADSSSVFRRMMSTGSLAIHLFDEAIETAETVDRALGFIVTGEFDANDFTQLVTVARFFKKYDCATALQNYYSRLAQDTFAPRVKTFIVAAALDDIEVCVRALKYPMPPWESNTASADQGADSAGVFTHGCQFDSATWAFNWTAATPVAYKWALDRAWKISGERGKTLSTEFFKFLKLAKGELSELRGWPVS